MFESAGHTCEQGGRGHLILNSGPQKDLLIKCFRINFSVFMMRKRVFPFSLLFQTVENSLATQLRLESSLKILLRSLLQPAIQDEYEIKIKYILIERKGEEAAESADDLFLAQALGVVVKLDCIPQTDN